ncbi:AzlC family ABC transporter permease [Aneurinibacillus thermoaerophilus]|uniref:AzlC family ABC transporter permease n=1 Tax=Aneurinibacillus thermoaerophilus TaxID=143495 RepID=A0ABX8Y862_ANETH|nr:AzlC family ABC transporter permease [Aneurinibacillus thermoaerophilus]MED0677815.1 AzlC family ABC transporter permease [Aneurinibacillus thermoaerophilus]MED0737564.1 AzlC family ABC transporter permease [Aneurinibacillus thermoaerophilus]MED0762891.1 AzlC family ABC transporter permease [Aneurinibacillus thermoaerophilus]QYY41319.1 AzlC family ABC transporter permease [Aneurinibacillus thermoaerophilus]
MSEKEVYLDYPTSNDESFIQGVKDCLPTVLGYLSIGFAAGVVEKTAGMSLAEIALMSLLLYAGSAQFIAAGMMAAGNPATAIIFTVFFVNLRHLLMSAAIAPYYRHLPVWKNVLIGSQLTDETFGVAATRLSGKARGSDRWMFGLNFTGYLNWLLANMAGGIFGQWLTSPEKFGLDFALPAMFIGLFMLQLIERSKFGVDLVVAISAVVIAIAGTVFVSENAGVLIAIIIAANIGVWIEKWK